MSWFRLPKKGAVDPAPEQPARETTPGVVTSDGASGRTVMRAGPGLDAAVTVSAGYKTLLYDLGGMRTVSSGPAAAPRQRRYGQSPAAAAAYLRHESHLRGLQARARLAEHPADPTIWLDRLTRMLAPGQYRVWEALDAIERAHPRQIEAWRQAVRLQPELLPEERLALEVAVLRWSPGQPPTPLRVAGATFSDVVDVVKRQRLGLQCCGGSAQCQCDNGLRGAFPKSLERFCHTSHLDEYEQLPPPLRSLVDRAVEHHTLVSPNPGVEQMVRDGGRSWDQVAEAWRAAGLVLVDDPAVNARFALERREGVILSDAFWARQRDLTLAQVAVWRDVKEGRRFSPQWPPEFVPHPDIQANITDLGSGILLRPSITIDGYFLPLLARAPDTAGWPPSLKAIAPKLNQLPDDASRREALPWLLLEYMMELVGSTRGHPAGINLHDLKQATADDPGLVGLYVEWAPDVRAEANAARAVYGSALENQAVDMLIKYAPALIDALGTGWAPKLPAVDAVVAACQAAGNAKPLAGVNLIGVQHLLMDNAVALESLTGLGLDPRRAAFLGVPYSTNATAAQRLRSLGFEVDTTERRGLRYDAWREVQVCELIRWGLALHAQNGKPIVAMDDGGYITRALAAYFPEQAHLFVVVEQTTRGITVAEQQPRLVSDVINVARSQAKQLELPAIAESIEGAVRARIGRFFPPDFASDKPALVLGYGWVGEVVARTLRDMGRRVVVMDPDPAARARAKAAGYQAVEKPEQLMHEAAIIAGCSGKQSLSAAQLASLSHGPVLFSCSSSNVEFELPSDSHFHEDLVMHSGGTSYVALSGGFPINFTGAAEVGPTRFIQYTRATMVHGVVQAALRLQGGEANHSPGIVPLDSERVAHVLSLAK